MGMVRLSHILYVRHKLTPDLLQGPLRHTAQSMSSLGAQPIVYWTLTAYVQWQTMLNQTSRNRQFTWQVCTQVAGMEYVANLFLRSADTLVNI